MKKGKTITTKDNKVVKNGSDIWYFDGVGIHGAELRIGYHDQRYIVFKHKKNAWATVASKQTLEFGNPIPESVTYHRKPTEYELKIGYGATHYRDFGPEEFLKPSTGNFVAIKKRIKAKNDGLIYTR